MYITKSKTQFPRSKLYCIIYCTETFSHTMKKIPFISHYIHYLYIQNTKGRLTNQIIILSFNIHTNTPDTELLLHMFMCQIHFCVHVSTECVPHILKIPLVLLCTNNV